MSARAVLATERATGDGKSRVRVLRSQVPLVLRPANPKGVEPWTQRARDVARVSLASGAAGPLGGDEFAFEVYVGHGSTLVLNEISATLLLPGPRGGRSHMTISVRVDEGATLVWLPEPVIAAHGCDHVHEVRVDLAQGARFVMREETLLGRHREQPGNLCQTVRMTHDGQPLYHQQLRFGPDADGWNSAAVVGAHRAVGSVIVVDPAWTSEAPPAASAFHTDAVLIPLNGPGVAVSAVAPDSLTLRRLLQRGLTELGQPWATEARGTARATTPIFNPSDTDEGGSRTTG